MTIQLSAKTQLDAEGDEVTPAELSRWLEYVPPGASLKPVMKDFGSQRDPDYKFVGMVAQWVETRD